MRAMNNTVDTFRNQVKKLLSMVVKFFYLLSDVIYYGKFKCFNENGLSLTVIDQLCIGNNNIVL